MSKAAASGDDVSREVSSSFLFVGRMTIIAAVLAAAGPLVAVFGAMVRDLGELERRIVSEALAFSFIATVGRFRSGAARLFLGLSLQAIPRAPADA
jgi:hypothetical protein